MAFRDGECQLSASQAVTTDAVSTNAYDLGAAGIDIGVGEPLVVDVNVEVAADKATGDETYSFEVIQSAASALSSPDVLVARTIPAATLVAGYTFQIEVPPGAVTKRYLGLNYNTGGTTPSITVSAFIQPRSMAQPQYKAYNDNVHIG